MPNSELKSQVRINRMLLHTSRTLCYTSNDFVFQFIYIARTVKLIMLTTIRSFCLVYFLYIYSDGYFVLWNFFILRMDCMNIEGITRSLLLVRIRNRAGYAPLAGWCRTYHICSAQPIPCPTSRTIRLIRFVPSKSWGGLSKCKAL